MLNLAGLTQDEFLAQYWQKKPLLIRQGFEAFQSPIDEHDLAGLAGEEMVESRLVIEEGDTPWQLKNGPFFGEDFEALPKEKWTLLVQAVDHFVPEIHDILRHFDFIPSWRLDDIMISYAPKGGSVGPHYDQYDVFLIQAQGQRHWQVGKVCDESDDYLKDTRLHILSQFEAVESWTLEPGDILYLPPGVSHHGVSQSDDCMTISVGFRAPTQADMAIEFGNFLATQLPASARYSDPDLSRQDNPGEITDAALARVQAHLKSLIDDKALLSQWFGQAMTEPKYLDNLEQDCGFSRDEIEEYLAADLELERNLASRFAFYDLTLFVDARSWSVKDDLRPLIQHLASGADIDLEMIQHYWQTESGSALLYDLLQMGALVFLQDDEP